MAHRAEQKKSPQRQTEGLPIGVCGLYFFSRYFPSAVMWIYHTLSPRRWRLDGVWCSWQWCAGASPACPRPRHNRRQYRTSLRISQAPHESRRSVPRLTLWRLTEAVPAFPSEAFPSYRANAGARAMRDNTATTRMVKTNALVMRFAPWSDFPYRRRRSNTCLFMEQYPKTNETSILSIPGLPTEAVCGRGDRAVR